MQNTDHIILLQLFIVMYDIIIYYIITSNAYKINTSHNEGFNLHNDDGKLHTILIQ